jgi:hypothetical protein
MTIKLYTATFFDRLGERCILGTSNVEAKSPGEAITKINSELDKAQSQLAKTPVAGGPRKL